MTRARPVEVYLEIGARRSFAGAIGWPGWCRWGRDPDAALAALLEYGPRYSAILRGTRLGFSAPAEPGALRVVERLPGSATTDFGAPGAAPAADAEPVQPADLRRFRIILEAGWRAFDGAVKAARGQPLRTGPRGGGRSLPAIVDHLLEADAAYLAAVGWKRPAAEGRIEDHLAATRAAILDALTASARGETPLRGPRGGRRWSPRYFVRRVGWHVFAHTWEIERRAG
jgi:hypothetical protein